MESQYLQTVTVHGREYQKFSIDYAIHLVPVDDVRRSYLRVRRTYQLTKT